MAQHTIDLPCIADTYCSYDNPSSNYGSAPLLRSGGYRLIGTDVVVLYYALTKFNTSVLPPRKKIIYVGLRVYSVKSMPAAEGAEVAFNLYDINWEDSTANYNNQGKTDVSYFSQFDWIAFTSGIPSNAWVEIDVTKTPIISAILDGDISDKGMIFLWRDHSPGPLSDDYWEVHSRENTNAPVLRVIYEDVPPNAPTPTEPIGTYKDSKSIVRFAWEYNSDVGGEQKKFDLQWSVDQSDWTTISETTQNTYYDMPADTFPAGNIYWRVRCYNEYDEVGDYCAIQSFYAIGAPSAPAINAIPTDTARPVVSWSAFSQQVYQLQILSGDTIVYDSGVVPGINIRSHKITAWLADGTYTIQMRIKNEYDMWSDWGSTTVTISTVKPDKPSITLQRSAYGVEINATGLIYRSDYNKDDYICIGTATGVYHDNTVASGKEYKYFVRAVSENDTFEDSDIKFIQSEFNYALIAPVSDLTNVFTFLHGLDGPPKRTYNRQTGGTTVQYAGRKYPVWEPTDHVSAGLSLQFYLETWDKVKAFTEIYDLNNTVLYRDGKGRKMYGTLNNLSVKDDILGYIISFTLDQVDYREELEV